MGQEEDSGDVSSFSQPSLVGPAATRTLARVRRLLPLVCSLYQDLLTMRAAATGGTPWQDPGNRERY